MSGTPEHRTPAARDRPGSATRPATPTVEDELIIRHLGRLVPYTPGQDVFAGSTTGVHFVQSAEALFRHSFGAQWSFPDFFFRMHLLRQPDSLALRPSPSSRPRQSKESVLHLLAQRKQQCLRSVGRFLRRWMTFCPIFCSRQTMALYDEVLDHHLTERAGTCDCEDSAVYQLLLVLTVDTWDAKGNKGTGLPSANEYFAIAQTFRASSGAEPTLRSLQSLILESIYLELCGNHVLLPTTVATAVRLAQVMGLHRHPRRFKLGPGERELRTRIWWSICILDVYVCGRPATHGQSRCTGLTAYRSVCVTYGMPHLINDADVDVCMPTECDFDDIDVYELPVPLPGETPAMQGFITLVRLCCILRRCVTGLYTTTERRNGQRRIPTLEQELRNWIYGEQALKDSEPLQHQQSEAAKFVRRYTITLAHMCMILIHQPALTFEEKVPQFAQSLETSVKAALSLLDTLKSPRHDKRDLYLQPSLSRILFQCALLCLYYCLYRRTTSIPSQNLLCHTATTETTEETLEHAISSTTALLGDRRRQYDASPSVASRQTSQTILHEAERFLEQTSQRIHSLVHGREEAATPATEAQQSRGAGESDASCIPDAFESGFDGWESSLWDLNAASLSEWSDALMAPEPFLGPGWDPFGTADSM